MEKDNSAFAILAQENERLQRENRQLREQLDQVRTLARNFLELTHLGAVPSSPSSSSLGPIVKTEAATTSTDIAGSATTSKERGSREEKADLSLVRRNSFRLQPIFENDKVVSVVAVHVPEKKRKGKKERKHADASTTTASSSTTVPLAVTPHKSSRTSGQSVSPSSGSNSLSEPGSSAQLVTKEKTDAGSGTATPTSSNLAFQFASPYSTESLTPPVPSKSGATALTSSAVIASSPAAQEFRNIEKKRKRHKKKSRPLISGTTDVQAILEGDSVDSGFMKESTRISQDTIRDVSEDIIEYNEKVSKYLQSLKIKVTPVLKAETLESLLEKNLTHENSAFYLVNISAVIEKYLEHKLFLPRAVPHYAIKSNPDIALVHTLHLLGCGFDCASMGELEEALSVGVAPDMIIFANPTKGKEHIQFAKEKGIKKMTFDNAEELKKIAAIFPEAELVLRALPETHAQSSTDLGIKFGATFEEAVALIVIAKTLNLNLIGISFHVGSNCFSTDSYVQALKMARSLFDVAEENGYKMTLLDIGGGFPGMRMISDWSACLIVGVNSGILTFPEIAATVGALIDHLFEPDVRVISEPGRFFCTSSYTLAVNIISKRERYVRRNPEDPTSEPELEVLYYLSDGIYGSFNNVIFDHAHPNPNQVVHRAGGFLLTVIEMKKSKLFGPTCDSLDVICDVELPALEVGDWLYFTNMGAYTVSSATRFNGFIPPNAHYFIDMS